MWNTFEGCCSALSSAANPYIFACVFMWLCACLCVCVCLVYLATLDVCFSKKNQPVPSSGCLLSSGGHIRLLSGTFAFHSAEFCRSVLKRISTHFPYGGAAREGSEKDPPCHESCVTNLSTLFSSVERKGRQDEHEESEFHFRMGECHE